MDICYFYRKALGLMLPKAALLRVVFVPYPRKGIGCCMLKLDDCCLVWISEEFHVPIVDAIFDRAPSLLPSDRSAPNVGIRVHPSHLADLHQCLRFSVHLAFGSYGGPRPQERQVYLAFL